MQAKAKHDSLKKFIIHVDMDAFYASVEQRDKPELAGKPLIVGARPEQRGVVAAASYEARKYGVHSAMPTSQAIRLCPRLIILPVRMKHYAQVSRQIRQIFLDYVPEIEPISLDEAFMDVTGSVRLFGSAENIGTAIKDRIDKELKLTASVGVAPNKFLAKLASDLDKPDGFVIITKENAQEIIDPLPVSRIWGIGRVTNKALQRQNIATIEQLRKTPLAVLRNVLGNQAAEILDLAHGIDPRPVEGFRQSKSVSAEETFTDDIIDKDVLLHVLHNQVEEVAYRLRAEQLEGKTVNLKLRHADFTTITRSLSLDNHTNITAVLEQEAKKLFAKWHKSSAVRLRLLGFGVSNLKKEGTGQLLLFEDEATVQQKKVDEVIDKIKAKYGSDIVRRGRR